MVRVHTVLAISLVLVLAVVTPNAAIAADGSSLDGEKNYMKAMAAGEMSVQASWDEDSSANLKQGIAEIFLLGKATDKRTGHELLQYRLANWAEGADKIEAEADGPFQAARHRHQ